MALSNSKGTLFHEEQNTPTGGGGTRLSLTTKMLVRIAWAALNNPVALGTGSAFQRLETDSHGQEDKHKNGVIRGVQRVPSSLVVFVHYCS